MSEVNTLKFLRIRLCWICPGHTFREKSKLLTCIRFLGLKSSLA
jgi:hypothetical protein